MKSIDAEHNRVTVARAEALGARGARLGGVSWISGVTPATPSRAQVRIRYRHGGVGATIEPEADGGALLHFDETVSAVTPGQAAVFYDGDTVLGGGWIEGSIA